MTNDLEMGEGVDHEADCGGLHGELLSAFWRDRDNHRIEENGGPPASWRSAGIILPFAPLAPSTLGATTLNFAPPFFTLVARAVTKAASVPSAMRQPIMRPLMVGLAFAKMLSAGDGCRSVRACTVARLC